ncbi:MAG: hypothetical protein Q4F99_02925 [bacterium]|nr:hypothetical protein [bacterium]
MGEIDTSSMSEAVQALLWVIGLLVAGGGGFYFGKNKKVTLEPNTVQVDKSLCQCHREDNEAEHKNAFSRIASLEQRVSHIEGEMPHINQALLRIENKLDDIRNHR